MINELKDREEPVEVAEHLPLFKIREKYLSYNWANEEKKDAEEEGKKAQKDLEGAMEEASELPKKQKSNKTNEEQAREAGIVLTVGELTGDDSVTIQEEELNLEKALEIIITAFKATRGVSGSISQQYLDDLKLDLQKMNEGKIEDLKQLLLLRNEGDDLQKQEEINKEIQGLTEAMRRLETEKETLETTKRTLEEENTTLKTELENKNSEIKQLKDTNADVKKKIESTEKEKENFRSYTKKIRRTIRKNKKNLKRQR